MPNSNASLRPLLTLAGLALVIGFLYWAKTVLVPLALATYLAFILTPAVNGLQRRGPGRVTSVLVVVLLAFGVVGGTGYFVGDQIASLVQQLPNYRDVISTKVRSLTGGEGALFSSLRRTVNEVTKEVEEARRGSAAEVERNKAAPEPHGWSPDRPLYAQIVDTGWGGMAEYAGPAAEALASAALVLVMVVFMLVQRENLRNRLVRLVGHGQLLHTTRAFDEGARRVSRFLVMQVSVNAGFGLALTAALIAASFLAQTPEDAATLRRYAVLWGFICGLMRFIPYIGTWVGAAMLFAFSVATLHGWTTPLLVAAIFIALEIVCANVVEPVLFGHSTGSSPLALLLAAAFWAWLWGPVGLLLSTPMTVVLVVMGKYVPQLNFLVILFGDEPALGEEFVLYQRLVARDQNEASDLIEEYLREHSVEDAYQNLLLPALTFARQDVDREDLDGEAARTLYQSVRELIDEFAPHESQPASGEAGPGPRKVLCCPARDEIDELALQMFAHLLRAQGREAEVLSSKMLTAEVLVKAREHCPGVAVVASVPPGGLSQTRYLCKRLKAADPEGKVVVGRWGPRDNYDRVRERLRAAGADAFGTTLAETRAEVLSLLPVVAAATAPAAKPREAEVEMTAGR